MYEANARIRDPVYGCVGAISLLQDQVSELQMQLAMAQAEIMSIQMQNQQTTALFQNQIAEFADDKSILLATANNFNNLQEYLNDFATSPNNVIQDPLKRESFWT